MSFNTETLALARKEGASDDEIWDHLISKDEKFATAKKQGANLSEVALFIEKKGGEKQNVQTNEESSRDQSQANKDSNEGRASNEQVSSVRPDGAKSSEQSPLQEHPEQLLRSDNSSEGRGQETQVQLKPEFVTGVKGGEQPSEKNRKDEAVLKGGDEGKKGREGLSIQNPEGYEAQISEKPSAFSKVQSQGEEKGFFGKAREKSADIQGKFFRGLGLAASQTQKYLDDFARVAINLNADSAEAVFGKNPFSDKAREIDQTVGKHFSDLVSGSELTPEEAKSPLNQFVFGTGKMVGDLVEAFATAGESTEAKGLQMASELPIWKSIADKSIHGMRHFAGPSLVAANDKISEEKTNGKSDVEALTSGMQTLFETEAGAALPMQMSSGLKTIIQRGVSRVLQSLPLVMAQNEISTMIGNIGKEQQEKTPTFTENLLNGNYEVAVAQLAQVAPMALLGLSGETAKSLRDKNLPATSAYLESLTEKQSKEPTPITPSAPKKAPQSESKLLETADTRLTELETKKNSGTELTEQEQGELSFLQGIPNAQEVGDFYKIGIRKPKEKGGILVETEVLQKRVDDAQAELAALEGKPKTKRNIDKKAQLERIINKNSDLIEKQKPLVVEEKTTAEGKTKKEDEKVTTKVQEPETGGVSFEQGVTFNREAEGEAEGGATQVVSEGKKEVTPKKKPEEMNNVGEAETLEEVDAFLKHFTEVANEAVELGGWSEKTKRTELSKARKEAIARKSELKKAAKAEKPKVTKVEKSPKTQIPESKPLEVKEEVKEVPAKPIKKGQEKPPKGTKIVSAAYRPNDGPNKGKVFTGPNHKAAMRAAGVKYSDIVSRYGTDPEREGPEFGYQTDKDAFISRDSAVDIARKAGQLDEAGHKQDVEDGLSLHSHRVNGLSGEPDKLQKFPGPGAMGLGEAEERKHDADVERGADVHKKLEGDKFTGEVGFDEWKTEFLKGKKKSNRYTEDYLQSLYDDSQSAAAYSKFYGKTSAESVGSRASWKGKSIDEIRDASTARTKDDIMQTNASIDADLQSIGLPSIMKEESLRFASVWPEAMKLMQDNAEYANTLIASLKGSIRNLEPVDKAVVAWKRAEALSKYLQTEKVLANASNPIRARQLSRDLAIQKLDFQRLAEIETRVNSSLGRSLAYLRTQLKVDFSYSAIAQKMKAAKKSGGIIADLSQEEKDSALNLSNAIQKLEDEVMESIKKRKIETTREALYQYLEFSRKIADLSEINKRFTPDQQLSRYTSMIKGANGDTMEIGLGIRGLVRALSEKLKTTNTEVLTDKIHERLKGLLGPDWSKDQTRAALDGTGGYHQLTQDGTNAQLERAVKDTEKFNKELNRVNKIKNPKERQKALSKLVADRELEVQNLEAMMETHIQDAATEASKIIEELSYELRSCE